MGLYEVQELPDGMRLYSPVWCHPHLACGVSLPEWLAGGMLGLWCPNFIFAHHGPDIDGTATIGWVFSCISFWDPYWRTGRGAITASCFADIAARYLFQDICIFIWTGLIQVLPTGFCCLFIEATRSLMACTWYILLTACRSFEPGTSWNGGCEIRL